MILPIVEYGHPALRSKGREVIKIDQKLIDLAQDMLETMIDADGVGLAAQQVGLSIQMCIVDIEGITDRPSTMRIAGESVDPNEYMPMVLINPAIEPVARPESGNEGCLSFPGLSAEIERPADIRVRTMLLDGSTLEFEAAGLLARAIQHEHDHLHGVLFIDRMETSARQKISPALDKLLKQNAL
jgi:peptide deformylase